MNASTLLPLYDRIAARVFDRVRDPVLLLVRLTMGWLFCATGWGKLGNLAGTAEYFASLGLPLAAANALFVGLLECAGGLLLLLGLGSRPAALLLAGNMLVAYLTAHRADLGSVRGFVEAAPYSYLVAALVVLAFGPGRWSLDRLLRSRVAAALDTPPAAQEARA
ncbi:MAG TPA: DoxX family protein [Planctomycetota bacterium]